MTRNPFDDIERMLTRMSQQFEDFEPESFTESIPIDIEDTGDSFVLTADLPGYQSDDIDVELAGESVSISATRDEETEEEGERYVRRERRHRSVSRSVRLPGAVDEAETEADFNNGVLTITFPKRDVDNGHSIPVN
ncbi:MAG: Hsp20/alpha crystallin family protein [Natronomonas sp.]